MEIAIIKRYKQIKFKIKTTCNCSHWCAYFATPNIKSVFDICDDLSLLMFSGPGLRPE